MKTDWFQDLTNNLDQLIDGSSQSELQEMINKVRKESLSDSDIILFDYDQFSETELLLDTDDELFLDFYDDDLDTDIFGFTISYDVFDENNQQVHCNNYNIAA